MLSSASFIAPGVFGVIRPVLLLPDGIANELAAAEFKAILAHELCHVRRRDNLVTMMHMVVEAVFWFHPLVWWLGGRLIDERERACDEEVMRSGSEPEVYAEGILKICELYLQSPLKCMAGVTGSNLTKRIEAIMNNPPALELSFAKKAWLAIAGVLAVAIPVILGVTEAPLLFRYVILDRDSKFDPDVIGFLKATGLKLKRTSVRSLWQNGIAERWVGSCRREILDHVIPLDEEHLRRLISVSSIASALRGSPRSLSTSANFTGTCSASRRRHL
jgi:hypothetical protein